MNQAVGSSNLSGHANIHEVYQAVIKLTANCFSSQYYHYGTFMGVSLTAPICRFNEVTQFGSRVAGRVPSRSDLWLQSLQSYRHRLKAWQNGGDHLCLSYRFQVIITNSSPTCCL